MKHQTMSGVMTPACLLIIWLSTAFGEESSQPALSAISEHPQVQLPLSQAYMDEEDEKAAWANQPTIYDKRGWQDMKSAGWGKRGWQDMKSAGWGKRGWQDMKSAGWGKRGWQDMKSAGWGKRGWQDLQGGWGKRAYPEYEEDDQADIEEDKRAWSSLKGTWGKRSPDWNSFRGSWGKRDPAWQNLKGLWGKRSIGDILASNPALNDFSSDLSRED